MLAFDAITKRYGALTALDALSLEVRPGEIFGLLGPNGAGKSTAMRMACGLLTPDAGTVRVLGGDPTSPKVRTRIGIAPQGLAIYPELSAFENVAFFAAICGVAAGQRRQRVDQSLAFVGLTERAGDRASGFSGGMQRRLNLACALVHDPELILLDEPTAGVDPQSRNAIFEHVEALRARGKTVVYTTHYMEEAERLCDRVAIVDHGRVLALDSPAELVRAHGGQSILVVERESGTERIATDNPLAALQQAQAAEPLRAFQLERPRLEQVFLHLTGRSLRD